MCVCVENPRGNRDTDQDNLAAWREETEFKGIPLFCHFTNRKPLFGAQIQGHGRKTKAPDLTQGPRHLSI